MKKTLFLAFSFLSSITLWGQVRFIQTNSIEDYETVLATVKQQDKLLWVAVHKDQGDFRKMYFDGVFKDPQLDRMQRAYTPIAVNIDGEMGERLSTIFAFDEFPSFLIMNKDEFVLSQVEGYQSSKQLSDVLNEIAKNPYRYDSLLMKYNDNTLSDTEWRELLELYALNFDFNNTALLALEYFNAKEKSNLLNKADLPLLCAYGLDLETPYPLFILDQQDQIETIYPAFELKEFQMQAMEYNLGLAINNQAPELFTQALELFLKPPFVKEDSLDFYREAYHSAYAEESGDFSLYADLVIKKADAMAPVLAADLLFDEAYAISEDYNVKSSLKGAYTLASYSDQKEASYRARMLMAYLQYLMEDREKAKADLQKARKMVSDPKELQNVNKLEELIDSKS